MKPCQTKYCDHMPSHKDWAACAKVLHDERERARFQSGEDWKRRAVLEMGLRDIQELGGPAALKATSTLALASPSASEEPFGDCPRCFKEDREPGFSMCRSCAEASVRETREKHEALVAAVARSSEASSEDPDAVCHKCGRGWPQMSLVNDGDDGLGPVVCVECWDPHYEEQRPNEACPMGYMGCTDDHAEEIPEVHRTDYPRPKVVGKLPNEMCICRPCAFHAERGEVAVPRAETPISRNLWVVTWEPPIKKGTVCRVFDDEEEASVFFRNQDSNGWGMNCKLLKHTARMWEDFPKADELREYLPSETGSEG